MRGSSLASVVRSTAALGLSPEGMQMLQQQAAALETVLGQAKARSLVELMGRARVGDVPRMGRQLAYADAARRILEVLLEQPHREARRALLPEAFMPTAPGAGPTDEDHATDEGSATDDDQDQDLLYTTPLQLLQAVDLYLSRLRGSGGRREAAAGVPLLDVPGRRGDDLADDLEGLRQDILEYWEESLEDDA